ncbi:MAG: DUF2461 family protein [Sphingomonadaceae bacterium]
MMPRDPFALLADLEEKSNRNRFAANRDAIEAAVRQPFANLLSAFTAGLAGSELPLKGGADTMSRANRAVRCSSDTRPCTPQMRGLLTSLLVTRDPARRMETSGALVRESAGIARACAALLRFGRGA